MIEFLKTVAPLMAIASMALIFAGRIPSLRGLKTYYFLCGEFSFVTAIAYRSLAVLEASSFARFGLGLVWLIASSIALGLWFIIGSVSFARAAFQATK